MNADNDQMAIWCKSFWNILNMVGGGVFELSRENFGNVFINTTSLLCNDDDEW